MRTSWIAGPALAFALLVLVPTTAYAHHCHTAEHCVEPGQPASALTIVVGTFLFTSAPPR